MKSLKRALTPNWAATIDEFQTLIVGLFLTAGAGALFFYWLSWQPATVEGYYAADISYSGCHYDGRGRKIILEAGEQRYELHYYMWQDRPGPESVMRELCGYSRARVWLTPESGTDIRGVITPTLTIDPSVGARRDRSNREALLHIVLALSAVGLGMFVSGVFKLNREA